MNNDVLSLERARDYELKNEKKIGPQERPEFHLSPRVGWMNDPNGFSYHDGKYHMFYQYHPYDTNWGPMHWGHAVSDDLLKWEFLPASLAPDQEYDRFGCFSGSATTLPDGRQLLMYTGVARERVNPDDPDDEEMTDIQTQCIAIGDGVDYVKYEGNPVLTEADLPEGASRVDFRDPKILRKEDGTYLCVIGSRPADGSGQILLYESEDGIHWKYKKVFAANYNRFGKMWECPDFFVLDGHGVLLTSPQDMLPQGFEYHNGNGTLCMIGKYDERTETFIEQYDQTIDYGIDFYAPQTVLTQDGRRVMIGWMQNWDTCVVRAEKQKWFGQMSLPRELSVVDGKLIQKPLRELEEKRANPIHFENIAFTDTIRLAGLKGRKIDMEMEVDAADAEHVYQKFVVYFAQSDQYQTSFSYRPHESVLKVDRKFSGSRRGTTHQRRAKVRNQNGKIKLRLILDSFSAEMFVNDGEQVMTITFYTPLDADGISFWADGRVKLTVTKYDLNADKQSAFMSK